MAVTTYGVNDALTNHQWSRALTAEMDKSAEFAGLFGDSMSAVIRRKNELRRAGDKITYGFRAQLTGVGVTEGGTLEGNEEDLTTYSDALFINELRHGVRGRNEGTIDDQRVLHNARLESETALRDWFRDRISLMTFMQLGGYTGTSITFEGNSLASDGRLYGFNAPTAPSTNRVLRAGTGLTTDQALEADATAYFTLDLIDLAIEKAKTANPKVSPARINGAPHYVLYLHPFQVKALWLNTSTGQWQQIVEQAKARSGSNPLFTGALGMYKNVILREHEHVVTGVHSTTSAEQTSVRRAVFLGQNAACFAQPTLRSARSERGIRYQWREESFDYAHDFGVACTTLWGMKKTVFNSEDFGVITIHTYAAEGALS